MPPNFLEGFFGLGADAAIIWTFMFGTTGAIAAAVGLLLLKEGSKANALRLLAMSVAAFVPAWLAYGKHQEWLVKANGVATGPIYESDALIVLLCMPATLILWLIFHRSNNVPKS